MRSVEALREQAEIMRGLAETFDMPAIKEKLLALAAQCEALANDLEAEAARREER
ncbi:MAG TPA: hypothetical protein VKY65_02995 [Alphaproteobacteria bacterium]|nr:hypothetical protein [Alphaproteobacteria bacterium]